MSYNNWKAGLDRYLTSEPPDDGFGSWCEAVGEHIPNSIWDNGLGEWFEIYDGEANTLLQKLFNEGILPEQAATTIISEYNSKHKQ